MRVVSPHSPQSKGSSHDTAPPANDRGHETPQLRRPDRPGLRRVRRHLRQALREVTRTPRACRDPRLPPLPRPGEAASWSYYNQALCALRFLYRVTLGKDWVLEGIPCPKGEKKLPVVLSPDEVAQFFEAVPHLKHRAILMSCFSRKWRNATSELYYNSAGVSPCESPARTIRLSRRSPSSGAI